MKKSGGLIAIIGSILNIVIAGVGLFSSAFSRDSEDKMFFGLLITCVFLNIIFSVLCLETKSKIPATLLLIFSVPCMVTVGGSTIFSMGLNLVGAIIVLFGNEIGQSINAGMNQMRGQPNYPQQQTTQARPPSIPLD